jgi:hypothetical protein
MKIDIPELKLPDYITSGRFDDVLAHQRARKEAYDCWRQGIENQFVCSKGTSRKFIFDLLTGRFDNKVCIEGVVVAREAENGRIELNFVGYPHMMGHIRSGWVLLDHPINKREVVEKMANRESWEHVPQRYDYEREKKIWEKTRPAIVVWCR